MKDVDSEMELRDAFRVLDSDGAPELSRIACALPACVALGKGQQQPRARDAVGVTRICARSIAGPSSSRSRRASASIAAIASGSAARTHVPSSRAP